MGENSVVRQALLKSEFASLYPGIVSNEWQPATMLLAQVTSIGRRLAPRVGVLARQASRRISAMPLTGSHWRLR